MKMKFRKEKIPFACKISSICNLLQKNGKEDLPNIKTHEFIFEI